MVSLQEYNVIYAQKVQTSMLPLRHINMSQALATKELSVNGPILENSVLVGGLTFFMIFMSQIFLISPVKYTWKHYGIVLLIYCRLA